MVSERDFSLVEMCVGDAVDLAAAKCAGAVGWVFDKQRVTFGQMKDGVDRTARALMALGIQPGDVVATWMPNRPEFAFLEFACAKVGAIIAAVNTRAKVLELEHHLKHGRPVVLFMVERFLKHDFIDVLQSVLTVPTRDGTVADPAVPHLKYVVSLEETPSSRFLSWDAFLSRSKEISTDLLRERQAERSMDEPMLIQYTSGTTSLPKAAFLAHRYVLNAGPALMQRLGVERGEAFLNTQPFYHIGGSCAALPAPLTLGCVLVSAEFYQADEILALIERERCVARSGYGAMYIMEMNHPDFASRDISSLRAGWCVGSATLMERVRDTMDIPGLVQIYAATEAGATSAWHDDPWDIRSNSCGTPLAGTEIRIVDPDTGAACATGAIGEIRMRGWWSMKGYLHQPDVTERTIDVEGWVRSGDLGWLDADGNLHFSSRLKDMLKIGGENVSAEEVETVLLGHADIVQASVIGAPDDRLEEVVMAIVELRRGASLDEAAVTEFCKSRMANFRVPRYVRFTTEWPMTDSGKIQKRLLRDRYLAKETAS